MKHSMLLKFFILIATTAFAGQSAAEEADVTEFNYAPKYINQYEVIRSPYYESADSDGLLPSLDGPAPATPKFPTRAIASIKAPAKIKAKAKSAKVAKAKAKSLAHPKRKVAASLQRKPFKVEAHASSRVARPDFLYRASPEQAPELQYH